MSFFSHRVAVYLSSLCRQVEPADVIILEGILVLHMQELRAHCNMLVYVDTGGACGQQHQL